MLIAHSSATLRTVNEAANWTSQTGTGRGIGIGCGLAGPADRVAAVDVRDRARMTWAFVNTPNVADTPQPVADTSDKPRTSIRSS